MGIIATIFAALAVIFLIIFVVMLFSVKKVNNVEEVWLVIFMVAYLLLYFGVI